MQLLYDLIVSLVDIHPKGAKLVEKNLQIQCLLYVLFLFLNCHEVWSNCQLVINEGNMADIQMKWSSATKEWNPVIFSNFTMDNHKRLNSE